MRTLRNIDARNLDDAIDIAVEAHAAGQVAAFSGGGTDLLQQLKDGTERPDVLINLRNVVGESQVSLRNDHIDIGGLISLTNLSEDSIVLEELPVSQPLCPALCGPHFPRPPHSPALPAHPPIRRANSDFVRRIRLGSPGHCGCL